MDDVKFENSISVELAKEFLKKLSDEELNRIALSDIKYDFTIDDYFRQAD